MKLVLPFPPSANRYWRSTVRAGFVRTYKSKEAKEYSTRAYWEARQQMQEPFTGEVVVRGTIYFPNKRGDLDNRLKVLLDSLEGAAYNNDSQIVRIDVSKDYDKADPRVELEITEAI